jgi:hypothetical protein
VVLSDLANVNFVTRVKIVPHRRHRHLATERVRARNLPQAFDAGAVADGQMLKGITGRRQWCWSASPMSPTRRRRRSVKMLTRTVARKSHPAAQRRHGLAARYLQCRPRRRCGRPYRLRRERPRYANGGAPGPNRVRAAPRLTTFATRGAAGEARYLTKQALV